MTELSLGKPNKNLPVAIILPAVLSVILFFMTIFFLVLPSMESALIAQRRNLIHEMTQLAWDTLDHYYAQTKTGQLSEADAQAEAMEHLRNLRYGPELKDYFWINDMHPRMIMHPYRPDLEGKDISHFSDPKGKRLFIEFVSTVAKNGAGFVDYQWQWKDDPDRIVPKISFVKGFEPWGWVVGTGIYTNDIAYEISRITRKLTLIGVGILFFIAGLSMIIILQSLSSEKKRFAAERQAQIQQEQLFQAGKMATLGTLSAGVAHEINNPTMAISLNAGILKEAWKSLKPVLDHHRQEQADFKVKEMDFSILYKRIPQLLNHIEDGARRIQNIVNELKDFSRISPPELKHDVPINTAVEKAIALVGNLIHRSTNSFSVKLAPNLPTFKGNMQKVEQVIVNLLVNAAQALTDKNQHIDITTGYDDKLKRVTVTVTDTGIGMSDETLSRIQDPFFTTKQSSGNSGLGLSISQRIMSDHGGNIEFTSRPHEGTRAFIYFPANPDKGAT